MTTSVFTKLLNERAIASCGRDLDEKLLLRFTALVHARMRQLTSSGFIQLTPIDIIRVMRDIPTGTKIELTLKNIILNGILNAENKCGGAGAIAMALYLVSQFEESLAIKPKTPRRCTVDEALRFTCELVLDPLVKDILKDVLYKAGSRGKVTFEVHPGKFLYKITNEDGIGIPGRIEQRFFEVLQFTNYIELSDIGLLVYDGIIENVSEIYRLCDEASKNRKTLVIAASAFSNDVISTLSVNWQNNVTRIIPVVLCDDPHAIDDLILAYELVPYGQKTGRPIKSVTLSEIKNVQSLKITPAMGVLLSTGKKEVIVARLKGIRSDISHALIKRQMAVYDMLREREKNLSVNAYYVYLGSEFGQAVHATKDKLELGCRAFGEVCNFGVVDVGTFTSKQGKCDQVTHWLNNMNPLSARAFDVGLSMAKSIKKSKDSIARGVIVDA